MIGVRTVREGHRVAVWNTTGRMRCVDGPKRLWLFRESVEPLVRYRAEAHEYLAIRRRDGTAEHVRGPADAWFDPVEHLAIEVLPLVPVDANEAIVIYRRGEGEEGGDAGAVARRVLRGPAQYMPEPDQWLHEFTWHGSDRKNPSRKVPCALRFTKLRVIPDQTYVNVTDVRTADDALLTVQAMIFFELDDIERMLDQTHDPIADFVNAMTADVIDFAAARPFERFKRDTERLNDAAAYPNLAARAERIGYRINKVVYRGYEANPKLQAMHDNAIEMRTALQLESETERQAQELADLKLAREAERSIKERELEREQTEHEQRMKQLVHDRELGERDANHRQAIEFRRESNAVALQHARDRHEARAAFLRSIQEMRVDLTRYLVARYRNPDRLIRIEGADANQFHLHDQ